METASGRQMAGVRCHSLQLPEAMCFGVRLPHPISDRNPAPEAKLVFTLRALLP